MKNSIKLDKRSYEYELIDMRDISCDAILRHDTDESLLLAILCNINKNTLLKEVANKFKTKNNKDAERLLCKIIDIR